MLFNKVIVYVKFIILFISFSVKASFFDDNNSVQILNKSSELSKQAIKAELIVEMKHAAGLRYYNHVLATKVKDDESIILLKRATNILISAANSGHNASIYHSLKSALLLANTAYEGKDCLKDYVTARKYYEIVEKTGLLTARYRLASMYYLGQGGRMNLPEALKLYKDLADTDNIDYLTDYAKLMEVEADKGNCNYDIAYIYFKKAVDGNSHIALINLNRLIKNPNLHIHADEKLFIENKHSADTMGHPHKQLCVAEAYYNGQGTPQNYKLAYKYYLKAADNNIGSAQNMLGYLYYVGRGVDQSYFLARFWYERLGTKLTADSHYNLAYILCKDHSNPIDLQKAFYHYDMAARCGHLEAIYKLGCMCNKGHILNDQFILGTPDPHKALEKYKIAANSGHIEAQYKAGLMYSNSHTSYYDIKQGFHYFGKAVEQNHVKAMFELALLHLTIEPPMGNKSKAIMLLKKAADLGHAEAKDFLNSANIASYEKN